MRQIQRLLKHGSSCAVTIPRPFMYSLNWILGTGVVLEILEDKKGLLVRLPRQDDFGPVTPPRMLFNPPEREP